MERVDYEESFVVSIDVEQKAGNTGIAEQVDSTRKVHGQHQKHAAPHEKSAHAKMELQRSLKGSIATLMLLR